MGRGRTASALALAVAAHAEIAALLPREMRSRPREASGTEASLVEIDIDRVETSPAIAPPPSPGTARSDERVSNARARAHANVGELATPREEGAAALSESGAELERGRAHREANDTWTFPTIGGDRLRQAVGIDGRTIALERAREREQPGDKRDGALTLSLDGIDAAAGRARTGPLREAVDEVARRAEAPFEGVAVFEITVGPKTPARARLLEASSQYGGWSALTGALDTVARSKTLRFPPDGRGLRVVVRVEAAMRLADGRREKDLGVKTTTTSLGIRDDAAPGESKVVLPSATLHIGGKVCSLSLTAGLTASPIGGGCSLETIGSRATRRITTTLLSEERVSLAQEPSAPSP